MTRRDLEIEPTSRPEEMVEPGARRAQADAVALVLVRERRRLRVSRIRDLDDETIRGAARDDLDAARSDPRLDPVADRVLDQRLQHQRGDERRLDLRVDRDLDLQAILEPHLL